MYRLGTPELVNSLPFAPAQEIPGRPRVCGPRVPVADVDGEEFEEAPRGGLPCPSDQRWQDGMAVCLWCGGFQYVDRLHCHLSAVNIPAFAIRTAAKTSSGLPSRLQGTT